jgi:hypothetical protein
MPDLEVPSVGTRIMIQLTSSPAVVNVAAPPRLPERDQPSFGDRCAHDAPSRLSYQHDQAYADRRTLRVDENGGRFAQDSASRARPGGMVLCAHGNRVQSDSHPESSCGDGMSLSGVLDVRRKDSQSRACGADDHQSILLPQPQTSGKTVSRPSF